MRSRRQTTPEVPSIRSRTGEAANGRATLLWFIARTLIGLGVVGRRVRRRGCGLRFAARRRTDRLDRRLAMFTGVPVVINVRHLLSFHEVARSSGMSSSMLSSGYHPSLSAGGAKARAGDGRSFRVFA